MALTKEGENFVRLAKIILEVVPENLRILFETEWNKKFQNNQWDETLKSGSFLVKEISKMNKSGMKCTHAIKQALAAGDKNQWDCTTIFFVLLYSELKIIPKARAQRKAPLLISEEIDKLREIRNGSFGHLASASIHEADYQQVISDIEQIFTNLCWVQGLQDIQSIKSSPVSTSEMKALEKKLREEKDKNDTVLVISKDVRMLKIVWFVTIVVLLVIAAGISYSFQTKEPRDIVVGMSDDLKRYYTNALENWTMPLLRFSKHKIFFGNTKKRRKTAMVEPLLREIIEKNDEKPAARSYQKHQRNSKMSDIQNTSLIKIRDIMQKDRKITIVQGTGGIGKTSLVDYITYQWAQNETFNQEGDIEFSFLFRFQCRSLNRYRGRKITASDLFMEKFKVNISDIEGGKAEKILIILDGFDEYFAYQGIFNIDSKEDSITSILRRLVTQETDLFPGHYTLVTGRHHAVDLLQNREKYTGKARWIEVLGFSEHAVTKYVDEFSEGNSSLARYIKYRMTSSVTLQSLATTPVFLRTLCSILCLEDSEFHAESMVKMTDIYSWIVGSFLKFHFASEERDFIEIPLRELLSRDDVRHFLRDISKDSYELLMANELEFDCKKLSSVNMSNPVIRNLVSGFVLKKEDEIEAKCEFWHVTMQEFFAGYYCFTNNMNVSKLQKVNWFQAVQFVAGFSSARNKTRKDIKHILLGDYLFKKQDSIDMIPSFFSNDAFFDPNYSRELKRNYLQIFFEAFDEEDELPFLDIAVKRAGPSNVATWEIYSLSDGSLFIHFAKLMIANKMEKKLGQLKLIANCIGWNLATFAGLFEAFPFCRFLHLTSVHMDIPLSDENSRRLFAPFKAGQHTLLGIFFSHCSMSKEVKNLLFKIIPLLREVVLIQQHISLQDVDTASVSVANARHEDPTKSAMKLVFFTSVACTFEKGSGKIFGKILAFVEGVQIDYLEKDFNEIKAIIKSIRKVLSTTTTSMSEKVKELALKPLEQGLEQGDLIDLAKIAPYLKVLDITGSILTNGFVSELVRCFLPLLQKEPNKVTLEKIVIRSSVLIKRGFLIEKLAKIMPYIKIMDFVDFKLSLYDYKVIFDTVFQAFTYNKMRSSLRLQVISLGNVFDGIHSLRNIFIDRLIMLKRRTEEVFFQTAPKTIKFSYELYANLISIGDKIDDSLMDGRFSTKDKHYLTAYKDMVYMFSKVRKELDHTLQMAVVVFRDIVALVTKVRSLLTSHQRKSFSRGQIQLFFDEVEVIDSLLTKLSSQEKNLSKRINITKEDSDWWAVEVERIIRNEAKCINTRSWAPSYVSPNRYYRFVLDEGSIDSTVSKELLGLWKAIISHGLMIEKNYAHKMNMFRRMYGYEENLLNSLVRRQKSQVMSHIKKIIRSFPIGVYYLNDDDARFVAYIDPKTKLLHLIDRSPQIWYEPVSPQ